MAVEGEFERFERFERFEEFERFEKFEEFERFEEFRVPRSVLWFEVIASLLFYYDRSDSIIGTVF